MLTIKCAYLVFFFHLIAMGTGTMRNTLLRRGSMQTQKPPPPIRRTSSITNTNASSMGSLEHLPPPPAFLLDPSPVHTKSHSPTPGKTVEDKDVFYHQQTLFSTLKCILFRPILLISFWDLLIKSLFVHCTK